MRESPFVLIVSACASHPGERGNSKRLLNLAVSLQQVGWTPVLLYTDFLDGDAAQMRNWWGEHYYYQPYRPGSPRWMLRRMARRLLPEGGTLRAWCRRRLRGGLGSASPPDNAGVARRIDSYYEPALDAMVERLHARYSFQAVIAEYVIMSRALLRFKDQRVTKLIDTHELFALGEAWKTAPSPKISFRITPEDELMAIRRADVVIAIQDHDAATLRAAGIRQVATVGHPVTVVETPAFDAALESKKILFVSSGHAFDVAGLQWFAREVFPKLSSWLRPEQVVVAGSIRDMIPNRPPFTFLGRVPDLASVYHGVRAVIAPLHEGTGLKIKVVEALGFGKALITTPFAALGIEDGMNKAFISAASSDEFASCVQRVMQDDAKCRWMMAGAMSYAHEWNLRQNAALKKVLQGTLTRLSPPTETSP